MTEITPAEVLRRAADLIEQKGWVQGVYERRGEGFCALGAIRAQIHDVPFATRRDALTALEASLPPRFQGWTPRWNDHPGRRAPSVIKHLRKVARDLEQGGE
jgi:hypothetical protein